MSRRNLRRWILCSLLISLMIPVSIVSSQALESHASGGEWTRSAGVSLDAEFSIDDSTRNASSLDYEFPASPPERSRERCEQLSRFCDWLAQYGALTEPDTGATEKSADPVVSENEESDEGSVSSNGSTRSVSENRSVVGWQSASVSVIQTSSRKEPVQLSVPSLSISARVSDVGIDSNRAMEVPDDVNTVGWYRYGPRPGEAGSSVIAGHLDDAQGRSVFYDLQHIKIGSDITITMDDGSVQDFSVTAKVAYDSQNLPAEIFKREGNPQLALLTCGGTWDSSAGRYTETVVVFAAPLR